MIQFLANFYATFFTTRFIPPRYDPANDIAHGIAPGGKYTTAEPGSACSSRDGGNRLSTLGNF